MQSYHHGGLQKLQLDGEEAGTSYAPYCPVNVVVNDENQKICLWKAGIHLCVHRHFLVADFVPLSQNEHITVIEY